MSTRAHIETQVRLSTAHAKARLSTTVEAEDCQKVGAWNAQVGMYNVQRGLLACVMAIRIQVH
jgi:hypothetical protein